MYFQLVQAARDWFRPIRGEMRYDFDEYYLCLMAGLATRHKEDLDPSEAIDLVEYYPGVYHPPARLIIATVLRAELESRGIDLANRGSLDAALRDMLDPISQSQLSDTAMRQVNRYAKGGFFWLQEQFDERPQSLQSFLLMYRNALKSAVSDGT